MSEFSAPDRAFDGFRRHERRTAGRRLARADDAAPASIDSCLRACSRAAKPPSRSASSATSRASASRARSSPIRSSRASSTSPSSRSADRAAARSSRRDLSSSARASARRSRRRSSSGRFALKPSFEYLLEEVDLIASVHRAVKLQDPTPDLSGFRLISLSADQKRDPAWARCRRRGRGGHGSTRSAGALRLHQRTRLPLHRKPQAHAHRHERARRDGHLALRSRPMGVARGHRRAFPLAARVGVSPARASRGSVALDLQRRRRAASASGRRRSRCPCHR